MFLRYLCQSPGHKTASVNQPLTLTTFLRTAVTGDWSVSITTPGLSSSLMCLSRFTSCMALGTRWSSQFEHYLSLSLPPIRHIIWVNQTNNNKKKKQNKKKKEENYSLMITSKPPPPLNPPFLEACVSTHKISIST